jgi:hypothetical protein
MPKINCLWGELAPRSQFPLYGSGQRSGEFGGKSPTVETLKIAQKWLASRDELDYEVQPKTQAELTTEREARDSVARVADKSANARERETAGLDEANQQARASIEKYYTASDAKTRVAAKVIIDRHLQLGVPAVNTLHEISCFAYVERLLQFPRGENHSDRESFRREIGAVIFAEKAVEANDRTDSAVWARIKNTLDDDVLGKYSRSVR